MGLYKFPLGEVTGDCFIYCCGHLAAHWAFIFGALKGSLVPRKWMFALAFSFHCLILYFPGCSYSLNVLMSLTCGSQ